MSELLQKLFKKYRQEEISKEDIALLLTEDKNFSKESLASKARIAKQAQLIIDTIKPSKLLMVFGLGLYLLLLTPPLVVGAFGFVAMNQSGYSKLTKLQKDEVNKYYDTMNTFQSLSGEEEQNLSIQDSMLKLDQYFSEHNISQPMPFKGALSSIVYPCSLSKELTTLYHWHNGVHYLLGDEDIYSTKEMQEYYENNIVINNYYRKYWRPISTEYTRGAIGMICEKKGFYRYIDENKTIKVYYNLAHLLAVSVDAFTSETYFYNEKNKEFYVDDRKLNKIKRNYLSEIDKKKYEKMVIYLKEKAKEQQYINNPYFKRIIIWQMQSLDDERLIPSLRLYINDKNEEIAQIAQSAIEIISEGSKHFPVKNVTVKIP